MNPEPGKEDLIVNRSTWGIKVLVFSTVIGFTALVIAIIAKRDTKTVPEERVATKEKTTTSSKTKVSEKLLSSKGNKPDMFAD